MNIILIGPMGAGKSTIGRRLANQLKREFIDSDKEIERRTGAPIPLIFELEGESGFRSREKAAISLLCQRRGMVLATGGGAILDSDNRALLSQSGWIVYLEVSIEEQLRRTAKDSGRPLLQTDNPRQRLEQLAQQREPLYRGLADCIVCTNDNNVIEAVEQIIHAFEQRPGGDR